METERYIISFFGINAQFYTVEFISHIWNKYAQKEYEKNGVFITAIIDLRHLVCGEIRGCSFGDNTHIITTTRNPSEVSEKDVYFNSLKNVIQEVRDELGNPCMTLSSQNINYHVFVQI